jgi:hypothetical protein
MNMNEYVSIANRDMLINLLNNKINELQKYKMGNIKQVKENQEKNIFLKEVVNDYKKYNDYILSQKQAQERQIEFLIQYLDKSMKEVGVTESTLIQSKIERENLLKELNKVKKNIDELINS